MEVAIPGQIRSTESAKARAAGAIGLGQAPIVSLRLIIRLAG
jgi:hypothetical protein